MSIQVNYGTSVMYLVKRLSTMKEYMNECFQKITLTSDMINDVSTSEYLMK